MRIRLLFIGVCLAAGISFGVAESLLWKRSLALIGLDTAVSSTGLLILASSFFALALTSVLYFLPAVLRLSVCPAHCIWPGVLSVAFGSVAYFLFMTLIIPVSYGGWLWTALISAGFSLPAALIVWLFTRGRPRRVLVSLKWGLLFFGLWLVAAASFKADPSMEDAFGVGGFSVFRSILLRSIDFVEPSPIGSALAGAALGSLVAVFWSRFRNTKASKAILLGSLVGGGLSLAVCISHLVQMAAVVGSGYSISTAVLGSLICNTAIGLVVSLSLLLVHSRPKVFAALLPGVLFLTLGAFYIHRAHSGSDVFKAAQRTYSYRTFVYMHYISGGGWHRTSDTRSDDLKLLIYDKLISRYPHSMYRPEAMFERATAAYDAWHFGDAVTTLADLHSQYRGSIGPTRVLLYLSLLADGRAAEAAHVSQSNDPLFRYWLCREGSRLAAIPYAELGLRARATGLYSKYLDYLLAEHDGKWVSSAAKNAEDTITDLQHAINEDKPLLSRVTGSVLGPEPIEGVRIALVKPQIDTSSLSDSRQFTGPRTLPLWQGRSTTAEANGEYALNAVPYGSYDIVVGLDAAAIPEGCVLQPLKSPVTVDAPSIKLPPIRFTSAVELLTPKDGEAVSCSPVLRWRAHPQALSYTVTVIAASASNADGQASSSAYTCWSKPGIRSTSVSVDAGGFNSPESCDEKAAGHLLPDKGYMWIVYACDAKGSIISSSEHYRLGHEPSFTTFRSEFKKTQVDSISNKEEN